MSQSDAHSGCRSALLPRQHHVWRPTRPLFLPWQLARGPRCRLACLTAHPPPPTPPSLHRPGLRAGEVVGSCTGANKAKFENALRELLTAEEMPQEALYPLTEAVAPP